MSTSEGLSTGRSGDSRSHHWRLVVDKNVAYHLTHNAGKSRNKFMKSFFNYTIQRRHSQHAHTLTLMNTRTPTLRIHVRKLYGTRTKIYKGLSFLDPLMYWSSSMPPPPTEIWALNGPNRRASLGARFSLPSPLSSLLPSRSIGGGGAEAGGGCRAWRVGGCLALAPFFAGSARRRRRRGGAMAVCSQPSVAAAEMLRPVWVRA
jgi:hypothetical protein